MTGTCGALVSCGYLLVTSQKGLRGKMKAQVRNYQPVCIATATEPVAKVAKPVKSAATAAVLITFSLFLAAIAAFPAIKNIAVVVAAGSKLPDVTLAELGKMCKGSQKAWPDGRSFTLVMKDPAAPEMHTAVQKLLGLGTADVKTTIAKLNESREIIKVVASEDDVFRTVTTTPGAVGLVDVYSINSAVKVLRVDGKLPFDVGYALK